MPFALRCILLAAMCLLAACSHSAPAPDPAPAPPGRTSFLPVTSNVELTGTIHLPAQLATGWKGPTDFRIHLVMSGQAEQIGSSPLRSHWQHHVTLKITDPPGQQVYVDTDLRAGGDSDQAPTEALADGARQLLKAAELAAQSADFAPGARPGPTTNATTQPGLNIDANVKLERLELGVPARPATTRPHP